MPRFVRPGWDDPKPETFWQKLSRQWHLSEMEKARRRFERPDPSFGMAGVRSRDFPCSDYAPVERRRVSLTVVEPPWGGCDTDGHYLCDGCEHRTTPERRAEITGYPTSDYDVR